MRHGRLAELQSVFPSTVDRAPAAVPPTARLPVTRNRRIPIEELPSRPPMFPPQALELFIEIEATPQHKRGPKVYNDRERELARLLGLTAEWWNGNSVCDDSDAPCWPPHLTAYQNWFRVRAVREQLLAAAEKMQAAE